MLRESTLRRVWALLTPRERRNAWLTLALVSVAALSAAFMVGSLLPFLTVLANPSRIHEVGQLQWAYTTFGFTSDFAFLIAMGALSFLIILVSNLLQLLRVYAITRYAQMRVYTISRRLLALYLSRPYEFFLNRNSGDLSTRVLSEVDQMVLSYLTPLANLISSALTIAAIVVLMIWVDPLIALASFVAFGGSYGLIYYFARRRLSVLGKQRVAANSNRFRAAKEVLAGIKEVKLHGNEAVYLERYSGACYRTNQTQVTSNLISQLPPYFMQIVVMGLVIILAVVIVDPVTYNTSGATALAEILPLIGVIAFAAQRMKPELTRLYGSLTKMRFGRAAVDVVLKDVEEAGGRWAGQLAPVTDPLRLESELVLKNVTFTYPEAGKSSLRETSLTIRAGERIGIVGSTGAGKTTLADLILGLLSPTSGQILADGIVIDDETRRRWQKCVAYVPQDIFLLDATIYENIAFGEPLKKIDRARVEKAARMAQLDTFIRSELAEGYETLTGERGVRLSGGQRQRIGIARALYHDADLIIFDEATSALDNLTERDVMSAIDAAPGDKTVVIIAHRLSTVQSCDRIVVLNHGTVDGIGSWHELIESNTTFKALASAA